MNYNVSHLCNREIDNNIKKCDIIILYIQKQIQNQYEIQKKK